MDTRLKKSPYKFVSNVPMYQDNIQDEVHFPVRILINCILHQLTFVLFHAGMA